MAFDLGAHRVRRRRPPRKDSPLRTSEAHLRAGKERETSQMRGKRSPLLRTGLAAG